MKSSHRRIIQALKAGNSIWYPARSKIAFICDNKVEGKQPETIRVSTLIDMATLKLIRLDSMGTMNSDTSALLI